ncbi:MAG: hypothetical protein P1V97_32130 [Planctomycetota bacterium]|nr:hypothetical protein [Planctomycetota bacterium]
MNVISLDLYIFLALLMPITALFLRLSWQERDEDLIRRQRIQDAFCMGLVLGLTIAAYSGYFICWGIGACVAAGYSIHRCRLPLRAGDHSRRYVLAPLGIAMTLAAFIPLLYLAKTGDQKAEVKMNEIAAIQAVFKVFDRIKEDPKNPITVDTKGLFSDPAPYKLEVRFTKTWDKKDSYYICAIPKRYGDKNPLQFAVLSFLNEKVGPTGMNCYVLEASGVLLTKDTGGVVSEDREEMKSWRILQIGKGKDIK